MFGMVTFVCYALYLALVLKCFHRTVNPWRIWHEGMTVLGLIILIAFCNFLLSSFLFHCTITIRLFLLFLNWTIIVGIFLTMLSVGIQYNRYLKDRMEDLLHNTTQEQKEVIITIHDTSSRGNDLVMPINDLLYIEAQKNNISVCFVKEDHAVSVDVHNTLTRTLEELKGYDNIFQCHRSFAVNVNNISSAKGNSNGYQLKLDKCADIIPVSRSFVPQFKTYLT